MTAEIPGHRVTLEDRHIDVPAQTLFRCRCSCGWVSVWESTNRVAGRGRRHVAGKRRAAMMRTRAAELEAGGDV